MEDPSSAGPSLHFDTYSLDLESGELRKNGSPVPLQSQPFKVLALLARRAGQVVTRDVFSALGSV